MERSRKIEGKEEVERGYRIVGIEGLAVGFCRTVVTCNFTNRRKKVLFYFLRALFYERLELPKATQIRFAKVTGI